MIIDTHCHINTHEFDSDRNEVINRAKENDVSPIIMIGMNQEANDLGFQLLNDYPDLYLAVGLHPTEIEEAYDEIKLLDYLKHPKVIAVGEIGIDLYWKKDNLEMQEAIFKKQLDLASKINKPVVIHQRNSISEIYEIVKNYPNIKGVMHCFTESLEWANKFIELGFYIGIGGTVTFKNATFVKEVATHIPIEKLVVETDSPYLAPTPYRGKRNEPAYTRLVVEEIARLRDLPIEVVKRKTSENAIKLFRIEASI